MKKVILFLSVLSLVFCSCRAELPENSSTNLIANSLESSSDEITENSSTVESEDTSSVDVEYYVEHYEDTPESFQDYHAQLHIGYVKPFNEGDTVKIDDLMQYFCLYEMLDRNTHELVDELKPYSIEGKYGQIRAPKQVVVDMLSRRFAVKIDSENSSFQDEEDESYLIFTMLFIDAGTAPAPVSTKVEITENGDITVIKFDELKVEKIEESDNFSVLPKYYYSMLREAEIGIKNHGTYEAQFVYYKQL